MTSWINLPSPNVLICISIIYVFLLFLTCLVAYLKKTNPGKDYTELSKRIKTFWIIAILLTFSLIVTTKIAMVFWAFVSYLALKEYFTMVPIRLVDRRVLFWAYLSIPFQYYWIGMGWYAMFNIFIPVFVFLFLPLRMVLLGETKGFLRAIGTVHWGVMMMVYCMSYIAALYLLPFNSLLPAGAQGLILYLLFLNQINDVAQFFWGKNFGKHKITPKVSPNKTIEGFLGGIVTTTLLAIIFAPFLTPLDLKHAFFLGIIIAFTGFVGDVTMSALKRDIGIKDTGQMLPGHGGILDRIDSLLFTTPIYFHFMYYFYF